MKIIAIYLLYFTLAIFLIAIGTWLFIEVFGGAPVEADRTGEISLVSIGAALSTLIVVIFMRMIMKSYPPEYLAHKEDGQ